MTGATQCNGSKPINSVWDNSRVTPPMLIPDLYEEAWSLSDSALPTKIGYA